MSHSTAVALCSLALGIAFRLPAVIPAHAQAPGLTLDAARAAARLASQELQSAREAVAAARGRERQAGAMSNPIFAYGREQTSGGGQRNSQNTFLLEQSLELGGTRAARRDAASARRQAAEARLVLATAQLDFEVARAFFLAVAADRRAELAAEAASAFEQALRVSAQRLAAGDISAYADRRLKLEVARYSVQRAEAALERRNARLALAALLTATSESTAALRGALAPLPAPIAAPTGTDSLLRLAVHTRLDLRIADLEVQAGMAEARLAGREWIPVPLFSAGLKTERVAGGSGAMSGFAGGIAIPLPLWDRRTGAVDAAEAETRRRRADLEALRRRVAREVMEAHDAYQAASEELAILAPQLGAESQAALRAAQVAYAEGEITLAEWLDAVRAYREAEASFATLQAEVLIRRAALERAVGTPIDRSGS